MSARSVMSSKIAVSSLFVLACLSGTAFGQVAPPPPPAGEPEAEFVPPPMPAPRPVQQRPQRPQGAQQTDARLTTELPPFPYPPLYSFCGTEDHRVDDVCTFESNVHYVALRPNPTISPSMVPRIQAIIIARRSRMESMVIDNLGVMEDIDGGLVQEISISDPVTLQEMLERVKPLTAPSNLTQELQNRKILSGTQAKFNIQIISEYQKAYGEFLRRTDPDNATDRFMQQMFNDSLAEAKQAFNGMLHESRTKMDDVLKEVDGVPSNVATALRALAIDDLEIDPEQIKASAEKVKLAWRPLTLEQKAAFLGAVRSTRGDQAQIPSVPTIDVMHGGKSVQNVGKDSVKVMDTATNVEVKDGRKVVTDKDENDQEDDG